MQRDPRAYLWDARESALAIQSFTAGMDAVSYASNPMAQAAVERKFEIIGEALNQLSKLDADLSARIPDLAQIVAFRNHLIHGYATVKAQGAASPPRANSANGSASAPSAASGAVRRNPSRRYWSCTRRSAGKYSSDHVT